jgi:hypothetical protein
MGAAGDGLHYSPDVRWILSSLLAAAAHIAAAARVLSQSAPSEPKLVLATSRGVGCVDVLKPPRPLSVKLNNCPAPCPRKMMNALRNHSERPWGERDSTLGRELVSHADVQCTAYHCDMLIRMMEVRRDPVTRGHHKAHGKSTRFRRITVEDRESRSRW